MHTDCAQRDRWFFEAGSLLRCARGLTHVHTKTFTFLTHASSLPTALSNPIVLIQHTFASARTHTHTLTQTHLRPFCRRFALFVSSLFLFPFVCVCVVASSKNAKPTILLTYQHTVLATHFECRSVIGLLFAGECVGTVACIKLPPTPCFARGFSSSFGRRLGGSYHSSASC